MNTLRLLYVLQRYFYAFALQDGWFIIALSGVYALILLDNALSIHELVGSFSKAHIPLVGQNRGEFAAFVAFGLAIGAILWWTYPSDSLENRAYVAGCVFLIGTLAFFAVAADLLHTLVTRFAPDTNEVLALLEDGGELIALSFNLAFVSAIASALSARLREHRHIAEFQ